MVRVIAWLVDLLIIFFVVRMVVRAISGSRRIPRGRPSERPLERPGGTLVRDPQCGTYIPESRALSVRSEHEVLYFCSTACRDAYQHRA